MKKRYFGPGLRNGYAMPAVLFLSTALFILSGAILQNSLAIRSSLLNQYYTRLAREAAEGGLIYSDDCIAQNLATLWNDSSQLKSNTDCSGTTNAGPATFESGNGWQATFSVKGLDI